MENQILELEKRYWSAMEKRDFSIVKSLTRFPCIVAGQDGVRSVDEDTFKKMFDSGEGRELKMIEISNDVVQVTGNCAMIAYKIELAYQVNGHESSNTCACTSTWIKENDNWVCGLHSESPITSQQRDHS